MTVDQSRVVIVIMDGVAISSDQRACERPGWDKGSGWGEHQEFSFDFAEFEIYLDIQVEMPLGSLVSKS